MTSETGVELLRRAEKCAQESLLTVDYYRIRRRVVFPLPLQEVPLAGMEVPGIPAYPWATWFSWALEERIFCLGWAAQWTGRAEFCDAAARELAMLASWPRYRQYESPDLCMAHFSRTLWAARSRWSWLSPELQTKIDAALGRIAMDALPLHCTFYGEALTAIEILESDEPHQYFHNIRVIGTIGAALAAMQSGTVEASKVFNRNLRVLVKTLLEMRTRGLSEGVSYDGYVLDFLADWMTALPENVRAELLGDARWSGFFEESLHLSTPGDLLEVAPLGDVEAEEMPFHLSAHAKLHNLQRVAPPAEQARREWYLRRLKPETLRADALAVLSELATKQSGEADNAQEPEIPPSFGAKDVQHAISLRTGWEKKDVAVAIAASNSPMGHIRANYGSLCIGTEGNWMIQAPGYQQYVMNSEREFTIGKTSRNTPLVNNSEVSIKAGRVLRYGEIQSGESPFDELRDSENKSWVEAVFDLTACYTSAIELHSLVRTVQLLAHEEETTVLVEDRFRPAGRGSVAYYWHAHPDAAWWVQDGFAMLYLNGRSLWISSPQAQIEFSDIQRLRGSRGQLTLIAHVTPSHGSVLNSSTLNSSFLNGSTTNGSSTNGSTANGNSTNGFSSSAAHSSDTETTGHVQWLFTFSEQPPQSIPFAFQGMKNHHLGVS